MNNRDYSEFFKEQKKNRLEIGVFYEEWTLQFW